MKGALRACRDASHEDPYTWGLSSMIRWHSGCVALPESAAAPRVHLCLCPGGRWLSARRVLRRSPGFPRPSRRIAVTTNPSTITDPMHAPTH
jgi:hypothetical protein